MSGPHIRGALVLGVAMLLVGFAAFTAFGLLRLLRPATD